MILAWFDKEIVINRIQNGRLHVEQLTLAQHADKDIMIEAVRMNDEPFLYASAALKADGVLIDYFSAAIEKVQRAIA